MRMSASDGPTIVLSKWFETRISAYVLSRMIVRAVNGWLIWLLQLNIISDDELPEFLAAYYANYEQQLHLRSLLLAPKSAHMKTTSNILDGRMCSSHFFFFFFLLFFFSLKKIMSRGTWVTLIGRDLLICLEFSIPVVTQGKLIICGTYVRSFGL